MNELWVLYLEELEFFFLINLFFIEGYLLYRILLFSVKSQQESAIWNSDNEKEFLL